MPTLSEARLRACRLWGYAAHPILSLVPVERPGLGTLSVDKFWRLYFDPKALADKPLDESAGVILHEVSHLLLAHHRRAERAVPADATQADWQRWNVATDFAINSLLRQQRIPLWDGVLYPEQAGFAQGLSGEEYYQLLTAKDEQDDAGQSDDQQDSQVGDQGSDQSQGEPDAIDDETTDNGEGASSADSGAGSDADDGGSEGENDAGASGPGDQRATGVERPASAPGAGDGGSCADGRQRPWELPSSEDSEVPGLKPHEADILVNEVAQRILDKQHGDGSGGWEVWAREVLNPKVDPRTALLRLVRQAVEVTSGQGDYSYRRPNRRNPRRDILRPSAVQPIPRITVIVDTSGSMDQRDLGLSLGLIGKVLNGFRIRDGIRVVTGDTHAVTQARVFDPRQIKMAGGGGTDMGVLIGQVAESKPKPQLIVVCTDGDTPWGEPVSVPVVACVTQETYVRQVPAWIKTVSLCT